MGGHQAADSEHHEDALFKRGCRRSTAEYFVNLRPCQLLLGGFDHDGGDDDSWEGEGPQ